MRGKTTGPQLLMRGSDIARSPMCAWRTFELPGDKTVVLATRVVETDAWERAMRRTAGCQRDVGEGRLRMLTRRMAGSKCEHNARGAERFLTPFENSGAELLRA